MGIPKFWGTRLMPNSKLCGWHQMSDNKFDGRQVLWLALNRHSLATCHWTRVWLAPNGNASKWESQCEKAIIGRWTWRGDWQKPAEIKLGRARC